MMPFGIYISFVVFLALNLVTGSSNSENQTKANLYQNNFEIPCRKPYRLPFRQLEWCTCPTIENCTSCFHMNLIAYIKNNTTVLVDFQGKYEVDSRGTLKIPKVLPKLDGMGYLCRVEYYLIGWRGKVRVLEIAKESPKISQGPRIVCVLEEAKFVLKCEAVGFPIPNIKWTINDELLQNQTGTECTYVKEKSTKNDAGSYICQAENSLGSYNHTVEVIVLPIQSCWSSHSDTSSTSRPRSSGYFPSSHGPSPPASSPSGESCKQVDFFTAIKNPKVLTLVVILLSLCSVLVLVLIAMCCCKHCPDRGVRCCFGCAICKNSIGRGSGGHTDNTEMLVVSGGQAVSINREQSFHPQMPAERL